MMQNGKNLQIIPTATALQEDPAFAYAAAFTKNYTSKYASPVYRISVNKDDELGQVIPERYYGDEPGGS